jgi:alcohol dehydrogenase class IV
MALASLFSGIALANAGLGAVHGFAGPVGGMFDAPHGAICAALLPQTMQANLAALRRRAPNSPALGRYAEAARLLTGRVDATPDDGVDAVRRLCARLRVRGLGHFGVSRAAVPTVVAAARRASSMKANPIELTEDELVELLESSL